MDDDLKFLSKWVEWMMVDPTKYKIN